jgi:hypothetical protein
MFFPFKLHRSAAIFLLGISAALPVASVLWSAQKQGNQKAAEPWGWRKFSNLLTSLARLNAKGEAQCCYVGFRTLLRRMFTERHFIAQLQGRGLRN